MAVNYVEVLVDGVARYFDIDIVKMRSKTAENESARVIVNRSKEVLQGEITPATKKKLIEYGQEANTKVYTGEDDFAEMINYISDLKYGKPKETDDEITRQLRRAFSGTCE